jgi:Fur family ferric uptake transcriptional regulator
MYLEKKGIEKLQNGILYYKKFMKVKHFDYREPLYQNENKTTVSVEHTYNTIELLLDCALVRKHQFGQNQAHYENHTSTNNMIILS